ncbi:NADH-cytochrome b5 reductase 1 isoform X2 [Cimex lectularius]|uniref:NADH-cytochrome b5 reductase n=1 Tax=Cimex lectularius TaxID=79782 RepID=A0A8I6RQ63_CIMLE|nr:NADH-cytochrome b5 reductase 1 isoform X2 [Cimex lectularius]XP_014250459.1 NADH-cytochrome b5 reductase 1 isoform X2 [Cimex lectularius]XP_014250460.1 NADH-cytochrome b5 reductase 1 isoform X2 [Cimex lectularius]XP_014250462.1 NADH-cytochrome b5 reductase 1 isoform X2 [Cimex lectularius]
MLPFQITIPVLVGIGIVVSTALVITYVFKKRKTHKRTLVDPTAKVSLQLIDKKSISHDTKRFRFQLPSNNHILGLPVGQHIFLTAQIDGEPVIRSYTPVSSDDDLGYMDLVVKVYMKNVHPKFPAGGKMSQYLDSLNIGDTVDIRGPSGRLKYLGNGNFSMKVLRKDPAYTVTVNKIAMIAGGTGITPMLQIIRHIIKTSDPTQMSLLFANQTEKDILLRDELEDIARNHSSRFQVWYTLDVPPPDWKYSTGFITADMIEKHLFPPSPDTLVVICGPPLMVNIACIPNLEKLGYDSKLRFAY